jgi:putative ABC transport system ATP-binding protein
MTLQLTDIHVTVTDGPDQLTILDGIDLDVAAGELVAITGASGSGKSTLVAVAGLLRRPDRGQLIIDGDDLTNAGNRHRTTTRRNKIGLIFQNPNLLPSLTAIEQLELVAHLNGKITDRDRDQARTLLDTVGLDDRRHHRPGQLSGGERQRVAIARALMGNPTVVLADEPTAALDEPRGCEIMALLAELTQQRQTATILVTHATHQLTDPHRTLSLRNGRLDAPATVGTPPTPIRAGATST